MYGDVSSAQRNELDAIVQGGGAQHLHEDDVVDESEPMTIDDLTTMKHVRCFACEQINSVTLQKNVHYQKMMRLYCDNAAQISKDAIFRLIKKYFDEQIRPNVDNAEWSMECIKEHFTKHTQYPSDEVLFQLRLMRALRTEMANYMVETQADGKKKFSATNIKNVIAIDKEIIALLKTMDSIPKMVGYNEILKY